MTSSGWDNLGDWSEPRESYAEAAEALAERLWRLSGAGVGARVIDVGAGYGAQLATWRRLGAADVVAMEPDTERAAAASARVAADAAVTVFEAAAQAVAGLDGGSRDVVLVVDALYHFVDRARFFREVRRVLDGGGRLVFCTVVSPDDFGVSSAWAAVGRGFEMPGGVPTEASLCRELAHAGFGDLSVEDWSVDVLDGFARQGGRCVGPATPMRRRARVAATRWGCRTALALGVRYVGVCAR